MLQYQQPPVFDPRMVSPYPSVLHNGQIDVFTHSPFDSRSNIHSMPASPNSSPRRQRISMACQYCRHRKIRCCGGKPCRNCDKAGRLCDYAPVPEEVNRATREKKAASKAARQFPTPGSGYSPYWVPSPGGYNNHLTYGAPPAPVARPVHLSHRRTVSTPNFDSAYGPATMPPAPLLASPAMFDTAAPVPQWSYNETAPTPQTSYPEHSNDHVVGFQPLLDPPQLSSNYSTPNVGSGYLRPPIPLTPINTQHHRTNTNSSTTTTQSSSSPATPAPYYMTNGYPTPSYSPATLLPFQQTNDSPTLAPEFSMSSAGKFDPLIGLGINLPSNAPVRQEAPLDMHLGLQMDQLYTTATY